MKRHIAAGLSILAVAATVGWKLASRPETSASLQEISLNQSSEHSNPGPALALAGIRIRLSTNDLAGIRIRLSTNDVGNELKATAHQVPQISVTAE